MNLIHQLFIPSKVQLVLSPSAVRACSASSVLKWVFIMVKICICLFYDYEESACVKGEYGEFSLCMHADKQNTAQD